jgi:hypothetical protein
MDKLFTNTSLMFYAVAIFGLLAHAVVRWSNGEIEGKLKDWFLVNKKASVHSFMAALGATVALILNGTVNDIHSGAHLLAVWGVSYFADSKLNNQDAH